MFLVSYFSDTIANKSIVPCTTDEEEDEDTNINRFIPTVSPSSNPSSAPSSTPTAFRPTFPPPTVAPTLPNPCYVIQGYFTIYHDGSRNITRDITNALETIEAAMADGVFDDSDPRILNVTYRNTPVGETRGAGGPSGIRWWVWVLIALGIVLFNCCVCYFFMARRRNNAEAAQAGAVAGDANGFDNGYAAPPYQDNAYGNAFDDEEQKEEDSQNRFQSV